MPADLSFLSNLYGIRPTQDVGAPMQPENDPVASVDALLKTLETARPPEPHKLKTWQTVLGGLGDAISVAAAVRAGGMPPQMGAFAANQMRQQQTYEQGVREADEYNRDTRNKVMIGAFEESQRAKREAENARIRGQQVNQFIRDSYFGIDDRPNSPTHGQRVRIVDFYDKFQPDQLVRRQYGEEAPFAPAIMAGVDEEGAGILRIPKGGGAATRVTGVGGGRIESQPPAGFIEDMGGEAGTLAGIPAVMQAFREAEQSVGGSEGTLRKIKNWVQAKGAATSAGSIVAPEELVNYYRSMRSILFPYIKSISGAAFPEQELQRYESQFPIPGVDPPDVAQNSWNVLIQQMARDMAAKYKAAGRTNPNAPPQTESIVDRAIRMAEEARRKRGGANANP